tara:strand:- start:266 stop:877 length:612 start_codon:yes stop_codon:yes gene_type:complete
MRYLAVSNWLRFQHYKNRDPTWLKLYRHLLNDYQWAQLPDASKGHLIGIWLMAAKLGNRIPADPTWLGKQIGATEPVDLEVLVSGGWLEWCASTVSPDHASNMLATCYQPASNVLAQGEEGGDDGEQYNGSSNLLALTHARARVGAPSLETEREKEKEKESYIEPAREGAELPPSFLSFTQEQRQQVEALAKLAADKRAGRTE